MSKYTILKSLFASAMLSAPVMAVTFELPTEFPSPGKNGSEIIICEYNLCYNNPGDDGCTGDDGEEIVIKEMPRFMCEKEGGKEWEPVTI